MTPEEEALQGERARQVLDNEVFKKAWEDAEHSIIQQMAEVSMRDNDMHSRLILALQILASVRKHIVVNMETGEMAKMQLTETNKVQRMFKR